MAYALLANTDPIVGIYTAFFPVIVYIFMGTSPHISQGERSVAFFFLFRLHCSVRRRRS